MMTYAGRARRPLDPFADGIAGQVNDRMGHEPKPLRASPGVGFGPRNSPSRAVAKLLDTVEKLVI
jgi:hypothetical protein